MPVNTKAVTSRRGVSYQSYDDLLTEAEELAQEQVTTVGNWTYPQILKHLAAALNASIDGIPFTVPWPMRIIGRLFLKSRFLNRAVPSGYTIPKSGEAQFKPQESVTLEEGLDDLRRAVNRCKAEAERTIHPLFGRMTRDEWDRFSLRHAEMHMSFVVPAT